MIIAGQITATTVYLVVVQNTNGELRLITPMNYVTNEFSGFTQILKLYLKKINKPIKFACFGIAGPVINNEVQTTNLPWQIKAAELEDEFSIGQVKLFNDLVATAHGLFELKPNKIISLNEGVDSKDGHIGLIASGDGLGQSLIYRDENNYYPYASEGGHVDFAPGNQIESDIWEYLYAENGQVEVEDILSFQGIENIFEFLLYSKKIKQPKWYSEVNEKPQKIIEYALAGDDDLAIETIDIFSDCFASETSNLALKGMTLGGIYIGGLIAKQIMMAIDKKRFMKRFVKNGKMETLLKNIPVSLILDDKTALLGAASYAMKKNLL
ncbi:MAG: hypothetical protein DRP35_07710 [Candidatus Zixiibacteriota bacterium]|nr:MAG: hypothetical protein DRP35_07710 [candidate division Zixibacteria bacterium]